MPDESAFNRKHDFTYGELESVAPGLRRITARNPSMFTFHGTGTYVIGEGSVAVVDPGPLLPAHIDALVEGLKGESISHVLVTHTHQDHSPACRLLRQFSNAPTYGYGPHGQGKFERGVMIEEGGDMDFVPDVTIRDGDVIEGDGWTVDCVYTPGHTSNHVCFGWREQKALLSGDHVMGWSTSIVSPPDGDMGDYMRSLEKLLDRDDQVYWPTHGAPIHKPRAYVRGFIAHRRLREQQILDRVAAGQHTIAEMVPGMYASIDPVLFPAAARSVFATTILLVEEGRLSIDEDETLTIESRLQLPDSENESPDPGR